MKRRKKKRIANRRESKTHALKRIVNILHCENGVLIKERNRLEFRLKASQEAYEMSKRQLLRFQNCAMICELQRETDNDRFRREEYAINLRIDLGFFRYSVRHSASQRFVSADEAAMQISIDAERKLYGFLREKFAEILGVPAVG